MTIFSLFSVFCGVFCWFTTFRKVNNMADNFKTVTLEGKINQIQFYPLSSKTLTDTGLSLSFSYTPAARATMTWGQGDAIITYQPELVTLDPYSLLEQNHPVLLVFKLTDSYTIENDKPLSIKASTPCSYLASDTLSNKIASGTAGIDYVSKIGNVYYFPVSSVIDYYAVGTTTPSFDYHFSPDKSAFSSFVSFSPTPTFHHEVSLYSTVSVTDQSAITANTTIVVGDIRYVSVIFDYYSDAIQYLYSYNLGDAVLSDDLQYLCDFTMEI